MIPEITDKNLYLLLPGKIVGAVELAANERHIAGLDALRQFYVSDTYRKLEKEDTKLWYLGPVALYEEWESR